MKNSILLVTGFSIIAIFFFQSTVVAQERVYENKKEGIRLKYSHNWSKREQDFGVIAVFLSPPEGGGDNFTENVTVAVQPRIQGTTLSEYAELLLGPLKQMEDFRQIETRNMTLAQTPATEIVYMGREDTFGKMMQYRRVWAIRNGKAYLITYNAEHSDYNRFYADADIIFDSFEFV